MDLEDVVEPEVVPPPLPDSEKHDIVLFVYPSCDGLPTWHPSGLSVMALLAFHHVEYNVVHSKNDGMSRAVRLPMLKVGSRVLHDCQDLSRRLSDFVLHRGQIHCDARLTPAQNAEKFALDELCQVLLSHALMRTWWLSPANREVIVPLALGHLPWPVRAVTARSRVRQVKELSVNRSKPLMMALMDACSCLDMKLGDQQFFFGDSPTSLDATVFANLCSMIYVSLPDSRVSVLIQRNFPRLVGYVQRILVEYLHVDLTKLTLPTEENFVPHRGILDVWLSPGVVDNFFRIGAVVCLGYVVMRTWEASTSE